jgi:hypothetical protein
MLVVNITSFLCCLIIALLDWAGVLARATPPWVGYLGITSAGLGIASATLLMLVDDRQRRLDRAAQSMARITLGIPTAAPSPIASQRAATGTMGPSWHRTIDDGKRATAEGLSVRERRLFNAQGRDLAGCMRCLDKWNWKRAHYTPEVGTRHSIIALCEQCWLMLGTPAARWPFYEALLYQWEADDCAPKQGTHQRIWEGLHVEVGIVLAIPPMPEGSR